MTTFTHSGLFKLASSVESRDRGTGIGALVGQAWHRLVAWNSERHAIRDLHMLNDYELRDIGITRGEIEAAVRGQLPRRGRHG